MDANIRVPSAFIKKPKQPLKRKRSTKRNFHTLPFVAGSRTQSESPYWHVPATGGYCGGYETGEAIALAFLKYLREEKDDSTVDWLTMMVESFMPRFEQVGGQAMKLCRREDRSDEFNSFNGQYVGFFNLISRCLKVAAKQLGSSLDELTEEELLHRANAGLGFDEVAYMASLDQDEE